MNRVVENDVIDEVRNHKNSARKLGLEPKTPSLQEGVIYRLTTILKDGIQGRNRIDIIRLRRTMLNPFSHLDVMQIIC